MIRFTCSSIHLLNRKIINFKIQDDVMVLYKRSRPIKPRIYFQNILLLGRKLKSALLLCNLRYICVI